MNAVLFLVIHHVFSEYFPKPLFNEYTVTSNKQVSDLKHGKRPIFLRCTLNSDSYHYEEHRQIKKAAKLFPQIDFYYVDCSYNDYICDQIYYSYNYAGYGYVRGNETKLIELERTFPDGTTPKKLQFYIDSIFNNENIYPIGPPMLELSPLTTDLFYRNAEHPIFLFYKSSKTDHYSFLSTWAKAANEEIYPEGNNYNVGYLDCDTFPNECTRWTKLTSISTSTAHIYSKLTNNYEVYYSYDTPITYDKIHGFIQNADLFQKKPLPTPNSNPTDFVNVTVEEGYKLLNNPSLQERTLDQVKFIYKRAFRKPSSGCEDPCPDSFESLYTCEEVNPSKEDHTNSLNILNFYRWFAGLSFLVSEDLEWSKNCQKAALHYHKLDYFLDVLPEDKVVSDDYSYSRYCGSTSISKTGVRSLLREESDDCFSSIIDFFKDDKSNFLVNRRWLLKPDLQKVGFGFYPQRRTNYYTIYIVDSISIIQVSDEEIFNNATYYFNDMENLDFISWPPCGFFPLDQLPEIWHITHKSFNYVSLSSLDIKIFRDDGFELKINSYSIDKNYNDQSTLILRMTEEAIKLCEEFRTITVSVKNSQTREHIYYSFELFNNSDIIDVCFYDDDDDECPSKVNGKYRFGPGEYDQDFLINSNSAIRIYIAQTIKLNSTLHIKNTNKIIIIGCTIQGTIRINNNVKLEIQNPSDTDFIIDWDINSDEKGEIKSKLNPKSYSIYVIEEKGYTMETYSISLGNLTSVSIFNSINRGPKNDVYYSINVESGSTCLNTLMLKSYEEYCDASYDYSYSDSNRMIVLDNFYVLSQMNSNKRIIKEYTSVTSKSIYGTYFIKSGNKKRDYEFYSAGGIFLFYCDLNIQKYVNSITFSRSNPTSSSDNIGFQVYRVKNINYPRSRCELNNITVNNASITVDVDNLYFSYVNGDSYAQKIYPDEFVDIFYANSYSIYAQGSNYKRNCLIESISSISDYVIYVNTGDSFIYESVLVYPKKENKENNYTFKIMSNNYPSYTLPNYESEMPTFYFENYTDLTIDNRLYQIYDYSDEFAYYTFHHFFNFSNCKNVRFINQPYRYSHEYGIYMKSHYYLTGGGDTFIDFGEDTLFEELTIIKEGSYKFLNTQVYKLYVFCNQEFIDMQFNFLIKIESAILILNSCSLLSDLTDIELIKSNNWPLLKLHNTNLNPEVITVDLNINSSELNPNDNDEFERHILIYGLLDGTSDSCSSIKNKVSLLNKGNFNLFCSGDNNYIYVQKGKNPEPDVDPGPEPEPKPKGKKKLPGWAIALIVIACIAFVAFVIAFFLTDYYCNCFCDGCCDACCYDCFCDCCCEDCCYDCFCDCCCENCFSDCCCDCFCNHCCDYCDYNCLCC